MSIWSAALPLVVGFILDLLIGDPYWMWHPIREVGNLIGVLEAWVRKRFAGHLTAGGIFLGILVLILPTACVFGVLWICYRISPWLGIAAESACCCYMLAARCLQKESMKVYRALKQGDTEGARKAVSMIVGRDTAVLDRDGITRAAVETVAENTSDGVTAPIFYMMFAGAVGGMCYKAANTMDSMLGYTDEKYREIGHFAARLDDVLNWPASRLTALFMIAASALLGYDWKNAWKIWKRDRRKHASPNSAQTESVCAGALDLRLAGDAWYFGTLHKKPYIGDPIRAIEPEDIPRACRLMYLTEVLMLIPAVLLRALIFGCFPLFL